jgi:hypothetical protein
MVSVRLVSVVAARSGPRTRYRAYNASLQAGSYGRRIGVS